MTIAMRARIPREHWFSRPAVSRFAVPLVLTLIVVVVLAGADVFALAQRNPSLLFGQHYYLALGDSISFGYQPDFNFTSGFVDDVFADLKKANVTTLVNYACAGETTVTMIYGNCQEHLIHHNAYTGPQLAAAVSFLKRYAGRVDPVTLDIGSNDVIGDFDLNTCAVVTGSTADLARLDSDLTQTILPQLRNAMGTHYQTGDLVMLNYYNPYARACPNSVGFVHELNAHLASDAAQFGIPVVDVYGAFGGDAHMAANICTYTWICNAQYHDIHPTTAGYRVIANAVEQTLGYPGIGGTNPLNVSAGLGN